jgi:ferritin
MAMASWCEVNGFAGAAKFLYAHSDEEREHMLKFVHFLNDRGGYAQFNALEQPSFKFDSLEALFMDVLDHERYVSKKINELVDLCLTEKDHTTNNFLQWFVTEQIEEESLAQEIVDKIKLVADSKGGNFHLDMLLSNMADAETAAGA